MVTMMGKSNLFYLCTIVACILMLLSLREVQGDELWSVCMRHPYDHPGPLLISFDPEAQPGDDFKPQIAGVIDESTMSLPYLGGIHVSPQRSELYFTLNGGFEGRSTNPFPRQEEEKEHHLQFLRQEASSIKRGDVPFTSGRILGGNTVLRHYTSNSPNRVVKFSGGYTDKMFGSIMGPGLTGDCTGKFYQFDEGNGLLMQFNYDTGKAMTMGISNSNTGYPSECMDCPRTMGITYNTANRHIYTTYVGFVDYNHTQLSLWIADLDTQHQTTIVTVLQDVPEELQMFPTIDSIEMSENNKAIWVLLSNEGISPPVRGGGERGQTMFMKIDLQTYQVTQSSVIFHSFYCGGLTHSLSRCLFSAAAVRT